MMIVRRAPRDCRRRLQKLARKPPTPELGRRLLAVLRLLDGHSVTDIAPMLEAARSSVYRWARRFNEPGLPGVLGAQRGRRPQRTLSPPLVHALVSLIEVSAQTLGYLSSTWSSPLMAFALKAHPDFDIHPSTVRRVLPKLNLVWRRARPTLNQTGPRKAEKLAAIDEAIEHCDANNTAVLYVDEADVDLPPRMGFGWRRRGAEQQSAIVTLRQNEKHYLASALHAGTGRLIGAEHFHKNTRLFLKLLNAVKRAYRRARRMVLILDNSIIHKTQAVKRWLAENPKFERRLQPVYPPWVNRIERLWKAMHDTVTRNHQCRTLTELGQRASRFLDVVQPFPGKGAMVWQS